MSRVLSTLHSALSRARWLGMVAVIVTLWWSQSLWLTHGASGRNDWGISLNVWEVRWKSVREYGQWPAFNPWQGGGLPVHPGLGPFSVQAAATLCLGPKAGLGVFIATYLLLGLWGYWRLGRRLFDGDVPAAFLAVIGTASPALALHLTAGHLIFANLLVWPAIFHFLLQAGRDPWAGLKAGLLFALGFNEFAFYLMQYGGAIVLVLWGWLWWRAPLPERSALGRFAFLGALAALPFMLPMLADILVVARDYPRVANTPASFTAGELARAYLLPARELEPAVFVPTMKSWWGSWEINCYLGWGAAGFFLFGCLRGRRWFHAAAALCFICTLGNLHWWEPMRWLMETPAFASLQSFNRLRLFTYLFFALGAAWGLAEAWRAAGARRCLRFAVGLLAAAAAAELLVVSHSIAGRSHVEFTGEGLANEQGGRFYQRAARRRLPAVFEGWPADLALYTRANIGIARESAAIDSSFRDQTRVRTVEDADYVGEFVQAGRPVQPAYWSPNRITFEHLDPAVPLVINLNRGHPWHNFDQPLFPGDRIVEFAKPFVVHPDARGRVDLTYVLPGRRAAWWTSGAALLACAAFCLYLRPRKINGGPPS